MTLESALTYVVALALPVWLLVEQIMIRLRRAGEDQAESAADTRVASSKAADPGPDGGPTASVLTRKAA